MAKKTDINVDYQKLRADIKNKTPQKLYVFWGEERYLLEASVKALRGFVPEGTEEFNHKRLDGKNMTMNELSEAVDSLPAFSDFTLTEVSDFDFSKTNEESREKLLEILSDIPNYACVIFLFDTLEFKLDARIKANAAIKKLFCSVEFKAQNEDDLTKWIAKHFRDGEKKIDKSTAEYLIFLTDGLMTTMDTEIEKLIAYCRGETVTKADIDTVVMPALDAVAYELTDAILAGNNDLAVKKLGELLLMNEAPHKILFSISAKLRQLLCARIYISAGKGMDQFMKLFGIRYEFQAKSVFNAARKMTLQQCCNMIGLSSKAAYKLNSSPSGQDGGDILTELVLMLALLQKGSRV